MTALQPGSDVLVVGAGPAGVVCALRLAALGAQITVVDPGVGPAIRLGESLTAGVGVMLSEVGIALPDLPGVQRSTGSRVRWSGEVLQTHADERETWLVDRHRFDRALHVHLRQRGVRLEVGVRARRPTMEGDRWHVPVDTASGRQVRTAPYLVDAGGRGLLGGGWRHSGRKTIARIAHARTADGIPPSSRLVALEHGWLWAGTVPGGRTSLALLSDPAPKSAPDDALRATIREAPDIGAMLASDDLHMVRSCEATARHARDPVGPTVVRVGAAAARLDPLSTQGVQAALRSALQGAVVLNTLAHHPERQAVASAFYTGRLRQTAADSARAAAEHYHAQSRLTATSFWRRRAELLANDVPVRPPPTPQTTVAWSPDLRVAPTGVLTGATIEALPALHHPALAGPIALPVEVQLDAVVEVARSPGPAALVAQRWASLIGAGRALELFETLWRRGVLAPTRRTSRGAAESVGRTAEGR